MVTTRARSQGTFTYTPYRIGVTTTRWTPTRRTFLTGALASAALAACSGGRRGGSPATTSGAGAAGGGPLVAPDVLESVEGLLDVELVVAGGPTPSGDGTRWAMTYNGTVPGPTLRVRPGDRLRIRLVNRLDEPTNLHTHGLGVSPSGAADDPFVMVGPGETHQYEYEVPTDHRSGLFWYHPHHHGRVAAQVGAGLAGAIVVVDALDEGALLAGTTERVLVLGDPRVSDDAATVVGASAMEQMQGRRGDGIVVNGVREPSIPAATGTIERWRLVNATPSRRLRLTIDGAEWWLAGTDGGRLPRPLAANDVRLAPGERVELLVPLRRAAEVRVTAATEASGMGAMMGGGATTQTVLRATVAGADAEPPAVDVALGEVASLADRTVARRRTVALAMGMGGGMGGGGMGGMGGGGGMSPTIDGRSFDAARTDIRAALDTMEEWTITASGQMAHPFHLHVWPFQVVARSDGRVEPGWKDVVDVPAGGWVRVRVPFDGLVGRTVYHCHILDHEDLGMMGVIEVG